MKRAIFLAVLIVAAASITDAQARSWSASRSPVADGRAAGSPSSPLSSPTFHAPAGFVHDPEAALGLGLTLLGGLAVPAHRLGVVLGHAPAV